MSNQQTITINADVIATLKGMDKVVNGLKSGLSEANTKIDFTKGAGSSISKLVDKFKNEFSKFNQLTESGQLKVGDTKEALKSGQNLINTYRELQRIIGDFKSLTVVDAKKLFPDAFDSKVETASQKLKDFIGNWDRLNGKQLKLDQARADLDGLTKKSQELKNNLTNTETLKVNTTTADQKVEETTNKVKELKSELKENLKLKINTAESDLDKNKQKRETFQQKINRVNSSGNFDTTGRSIRYKGATLNEWQNGIGKAAGMSYQQTAGAIKALQNYSQLMTELKQVTAEISKQEKAVNSYKAAWADFDNISNEKLGKKLSEMGFSVDEIEQIQNAISGANTAIEKQAEARTRLAEAEANNAKIEKDLNKTNLDIDKKSNEIKELERSIESLQTKVNFDSLQKSFKDLGIDITPEMLKNEQGVESLKNKLHELDNQKLVDLIQNLEKMGASSQQAKDFVQQLSGRMVELGNTASNINRANQEMEQLKNQVLQFFSIGNAVQLFKRAVQSAMDTVKELDATMTETATVTDFSVADMWSQLATYSAEANKLGAKINDLYAATTLYYQQGLNTNQSMAAGVETLKMARIASMDASAATDLMTAALRGFNMEVNEMNAQRVNDVYSELAAITAADTQEIGTAMSKTASIANSANMEFETTAAFLSQIIETTREAPETAGTAMKTIIARFTEMKKLYTEEQLTTGVDAEGEAFDINKIDTALKSIGMSLQGFMTGAEGIDDVLLELASKWDTLDIATQRYIATQAAGSRQQSRFLAMMGDYDRTMELVDAAYNSAGSSQEQFEKTLDSMESKLNELKNAWDTFVMGLANNEALKAGIDALTNILNLLNSIINAITGGNGAAKSVTSLILAFSAFKGIKKLLGQTSFGKIFGAREGETAGQSFTQRFMAGIQEKLQNLHNNGGIGKAFLSKFSPVLKFDPTQTYNLGKDFKFDFSNVDFSQGAGKSLRLSISNQLADLRREGNTNYGDIIGFKKTFKDEGLDAATKKFPDIANKIKLTGEEAEKAGAKFIKYQGQMQNLGNAAMIAGVALQGIAALMKSLGASDDAVSVVKNLGAAFMVMGPILGMVAQMAMTANVAFSTFAAWALPIMAVVAAIVALSTALYNMSDEKRIKDLSESIAQANENMEKAKQAISDITEQKKSLDDMQESFNQLAKGSQEWKEQLVQINQQVLELIEKYPQLRLIKGANGQLDVTGYDDVIEAQNNIYDFNLVSKATSEIEKSDLELKGKFEDKFIPYIPDAAPTSIGTYQGIDALLSTENWIKLAAALGENGISTVQETDKEAISDIYKELDLAPGYFEAVFNKIKDDTDFSKLITETIDNENYRDSVTQGVIESIASKDEIIGLDYINGLKNIYSDLDFSEEIDNKIEELNLSDSEWKEAYADEMGYKYQNGKIYTDDTLQTEVEDTMETIKKAVASSDITDDIADNMTKINGVLLKLQYSSKDAVTGLGNADTLLRTLSADGEALTGIDISSIEDNFTEGEEITVESFRKVLKDIIGPEGITQLEEAGVTIQQIFDNYQMAQESLQKAKNDFINSYTPNGKKGEFLSNLDLSTDQVRSFQEVFEEIFSRGGNTTEVMSQIEDIMSKITKGTEEYNQALNLLSNTNYKSKDSIEDTIDALVDLGIISESSAKEITTNLEIAAEAIRGLNLDELKNKLSGLASVQDSIQSKVENEENTFTNDEIQQLIDADLDIDTSDFVMTGLDEYTYIGDIETLLSSIDGTASSILSEMTGELSEAVKKGEAIESFIGKNETVTIDENELSNKNFVNQVAAGTITEDDIIESFTGKSDDLRKIVAQMGAIPGELFGQPLSLEALAMLIATNIQSNYGVNGEILTENQTKLNDQGRINLQGAYATAGLDENNNIKDYKTILAENSEITEYNDSMAQEEYNKYISARIKNEKGLSDELARASKEMGVNAESLQELGLNAREAQKREDALNDSIKENADVLKSGDKDSTAYATALSDVADKAKKLFGDNATQEFVEENLDLFTQIAEGGEEAEEAYDKIREKIAQLALADLNLPEQQLSKIQELISELNNTDFGITGYADVSNIISELGLVKSNVDQVAGVLEALGYETDIRHVGDKIEHIPIPLGLGPDGKPNIDSFEYKIPIYSYKMKKTTGSGTKGYAPKGSSGGGGGGGGGGGSSKSEDTKTWKNHFDKYYNTVEKINELLRQRNKLEYDYDKLLTRNSTTLKNVEKNISKQLKNLREEAKEQQYLANGRLDQLRSTKNATYEVKEGRKISYQQAFNEAGGSGDLSSYVRYDEEKGQRVIDWDRINGIVEEEQGKVLEAYESELAEREDSYEEAIDKLDDIESAITEIIDKQLEERVNYIQTIRDMLVDSYQRQIDKLSDLNDTISNANQNILNGIQESIDLERQIRDNTDTEKDISDKEARLAYLRRDTSGANDLEIKQLEEELGDMRQDYSDTLVDQAIDRLSQQNEKAQEARERQIEIMQSQLDWWSKSGYFNKTIAAMNESELKELFKNYNDWFGQTESEKINLLKEFNQLYLAGNSGNKELAAADSLYGEKRDYTLTDAKGNTFKVHFNSTTGMWENKEGTIKLSSDDISSANIVKNTLKTNKDFSPSQNIVGSSQNKSNQGRSYAVPSDFNEIIRQGASGWKVQTIQWALNSLGFGNSGTSGVDGKYGSGTAMAIKNFQKAMGISADGIFGPKTAQAFKVKGYKTGGLANYTGPAWLDGTPSKPELVLNARDTQNFIVLKDVLADLVKNGTTKQEKSGDNYYDFHINVEQIANDYDVEKMIQKVKEEINKDSTYRNVNSINFMR